VNITLFPPPQFPNFQHKPYYPPSPLNSRTEYMEQTREFPKQKIVKWSTKTSLKDRESNFVVVLLKQ
jgi:hypothetical protein